MQQGKEENVNNNDGISVNVLALKLYEHIKYLRSRWRLLLIFFAIGAFAGLGYALLKKPRYVAQITFTLDDANSSTTSISGLASQLGISIGSQKQSIFSGYNIISFFQSRLMVQKTLLTAVPYKKDSTLLVNRYIDFNYYHKKWGSDTALRNLTFVKGKPLTRLQDSVLGEFYNIIVAKQLDVERVDKRLSILSLTYVCEDELFAKDFAEALSKNVINFYTTNRIEKSVKNINILQHETDSIRNLLKYSMTNVASSTDAVPNANPQRKILNVSAQNKGVDVEINRTALMQLETNLGAAKVTLAQETPLIDFIDRPILPLEKMKTSKVKAIAFGGIVGLVIALCVVTLRRKTY